ncbi:MAG: NAD(P)/FAD-dependent oxidoreductase [Bellilinea sp.]|nr:NAD(P)/FAD-dependent oxidoreductase [Bellilinea sp.]
MSTRKTPHVVVIGAGIGGLTAGCLLLKAGVRVTVLEAHVYPGGSAGTFYHQGYRFDAGATLAGGFGESGPHTRLAQILGIEWPVQPVDPAWVTMIEGLPIFQWTERQKWHEEIERQFPESRAFWRLQEWLAEQAWQISARDFPFPPQNVGDFLQIGAAMRPDTLLAAPFGLLTIGHLLPRSASPALRTFVDAQLLISAQTTSRFANALYGSAALDLPRRGVNHVRGGVGSLAKILADWLIANGGVVHYRQQVEQITPAPNGEVILRTRKGLEISADAAVANLTPWGLAQLLGEETPKPLGKEIHTRPAGWGAFTLYLGLDNSRLPPLQADHFQVVVHPEQPLGEGNSVFISLSPLDDPSRAPTGMRAATLSTHTRVADWWNNDPSAYEEKRAAYTEKLLMAAEMAIPGLRRAIRLCLPGTPRTFAFYTRRPMGMVGGFPQTSLLKARGSWTGIERIWLVGDSIFPGQSTAGVTLGAMRVARQVEAYFADRKRRFPVARFDWDRFPST